MKILLPLLAIGALSTAAFAQDQTVPTVPAPVNSTPVPTTPFFSDVPRDHWAFAAVQKLAAAGIIEGVPPRAVATTERVVATAPAPAKVAAKTPVKRVAAAAKKAVR